MKTLSKTLRCLLILGIATCALTSCNSTTEPVESETKSSSKIISRQRLATFEQRVAELNATYASMATIQTEDNIESAQEKERLKDIAKADLDGAKKGAATGAEHGEIAGDVLAALSGTTISPLAAITTGAIVGALVYGICNSWQQAQRPDTLTITSCAFAMNEVETSTELANYKFGNFGYFHNAILASLNDNYGLENIASMSEFINYACDDINTNIGITISESSKSEILTNLSDFSNNGFFPQNDNEAYIDAITADFCDNLINTQPNLREAYTADYMQLIEEEFSDNDEVIETSTMLISVGYYSSLLWHVTTNQNIGDDI